MSLPINCLPDELKQIIVKDLNYEETKKMSQVSKIWHQICRDPSILEEKLKDTFPSYQHVLNFEDPDKEYVYFSRDLPLLALVRSYTTGLTYIRGLEKTTDRYALAKKVRQDGWINKLNQKVLNLKGHNLTVLPMELTTLDKVEELIIGNERLLNLKEVTEKMKGLKKIVIAKPVTKEPVE